MGELSLIFSGWRLTVTADEADMLARGLASGLEKLRSTQRPKGGTPAEPAAAARNAAGRDEAQHIVAPLASDPEAIQQRARALIQASIRDKGPAPRDESPD